MATAVSTTRRTMRGFRHGSVVGAFHCDIRAHCHTGANCDTGARR